MQSHDEHDYTQRARANSVHAEGTRDCCVDGVGGVVESMTMPCVMRVTETLRAS